MGKARYLLLIVRGFLCCWGHVFSGYMKMFSPDPKSGSFGQRAFSDSKKCPSADAGGRGGAGSAGDDVSDRRFVAGKLYSCIVLLIVIGFRRWNGIGCWLVANGVELHESEFVAIGRR